MYLVTRKRGRKNENLEKNIYGMIAIEKVFNKLFETLRNV
jgi:hypothetical protein